jgi:hypothetical protein
VRKRGGVGRSCLFVAVALSNYHEAIDITGLSKVMGGRGALHMALPFFFLFFFGTQWPAF